MRHNITDEQFLKALLKQLRNNAFVTVYMDGFYRVIKREELRLEGGTGDVEPPYNSLIVICAHSPPAVAITGLDFSVSLDSTEWLKDLQDALDESCEFTKAAIKEMRDEELRREDEAAVAKREKAMARWLCQ
jgi:hypothetical protein